MHGYPLFSFWILKALAKFCFLCIVLNQAKKHPCISRHHPWENRESRDVQNVCADAVTKVGTVLNVKHIVRILIVINIIIAFQLLSLSCVLIKQPACLYGVKRRWFKERPLILTLKAKAERKQLFGEQ